VFYLNLPPKVPILNFEILAQHYSEEPSGGGMEIIVDTKSFFLTPIILEPPPILRPSKINKLYVGFIKALEASGSLKTFTAWMVSRKFRSVHKKMLTWEILEGKDTLLKEVLPDLPQKQRVDGHKLKRRIAQFIDFGPDELLKEVIWASVNQPKDPNYCYALGLACGIFTGKELEKWVNREHTTLPGLFSRIDKARRINSDIRSVLSELQINDLREFRQNKKLRNRFFAMVNEKIRKMEGHEMSEQRIMNIARSILKTSLS
jgi:hypothetical protein